MKAIIQTEITIDVKYIQLSAKVRYWEDSTFNGVDDTENGDLVPFKVIDLWKPKIEIDSGIITNWPKGTEAFIHYKVCDLCAYSLLDEDGNEVYSKDWSYVPDTLCPHEPGYGDYIIMKINGEGLIENWDPDINDLIDE